MHDTRRIAHKLSTLVDLGLERVESCPLTTEALRLGRRTYRVTAGRPAMGTYVSLTVLARSRGRAEAAIGRAYEEMDRLLGILSRHDPTTALSYLNQQGRIDAPPPEVSHLVSRSLLYNRLSRGAFDASVKPLLDLFAAREVGAHQHRVRDEAVMEVLERVGSRYIEISPRVVRFRRPGVEITLDGIAKGYIVDRIGGVLNENQIADYLINAGGDILTAGTKEHRLPWTVAVQDPGKNGDFSDVIQLRDAAVATSGSYERYFDLQQVHHHIVSSTTGCSPESNKSVSVVAPTALAADALATAVFVMEPTCAIELLATLPGCECLIIDKSGLHVRSPGWPSSGPVKAKGPQDD